MADGGFKFIAKKTPLQLALEEAEAVQRASALAIREKTEQEKLKERAAKRGIYIEPNEAKDKIKVIFDDSGSMSGQKILDAHAGCVEFLRNCQINQVAVGIYPMNVEAIEIETNLPQVAALIPHIKAQGGTPMFGTLRKAMDEEVKATRYIIFSDGAPTDGGQSITYPNDIYHVSTDLMVTCIDRAKESETPIDTVWIKEEGYQFNRSSYKDEDRKEYKILKHIADSTGGIFLVFDRNKVNFATAFKYLSPGMRHLLSSDVFRDNVQAGKV